MSAHTHNFVYQGQATWPSKYTRPGSGARDRFYGDLYYCGECLCRRITNERVLGHTYEPVRFAAVEYSEKPE